MSVLSQLFQYLQIPTSESGLALAQRLFHGRGKAYAGLEHITIDWLPPVALITLFAPESESEIEAVADKLLSLIPRCRSVQLQHRYHLSGHFSVIRGENIKQLTIKEGNLFYHINLGKNRNTGLFLDMKNGRKWVQEHCQNKRVLNLFAYTCGFSIAAIAGQASSVLNVDMSRSALNAGRENHRLNQQSLEQVSFEKLNIFKSFGRFKKRGPFDLLICDPPTFQKGSVDIKNDYPKIIKRLKEFMAAESHLVLCLNSPDLDANFLIEHVSNLAPEFKFVKQIKPPEVYLDKEEKGLKILYFKMNNVIRQKEGQ